VAGARKREAAGTAGVKVGERLDERRRARGSWECWLMCERGREAEGRGKDVLLGLCLPVAAATMRALRETRGGGRGVPCWGVSGSVRRRKKEGKAYCWECGCRWGRQRWQRCRRRNRSWC